MPTWGYRPPSGPAPDVATPLAGSCRAYTPDAPEEHGWLYALAIRARRAGGSSPTVSLAVYSATAGGSPVTRLANTATFLVTGAVDAEFQRDLGVAVMLTNGLHRSLAVMVTGADLQAGMTGAANIPQADDKLMYWDDGQSSHPPHDTFDVDQSSIEGHLALWGLYETNVPPDAPSTVTPGSGDDDAPQQIGDYTPTFSFPFRDDNETLPNGLAGDKLKRGRVRVTRTSTGALVWDSGAINATTAQQAARQMTIAYSGPALAGGTGYTVIATVADRYDAWSPPSTPRYFTIGSGKVDTSDGTPSGKTNDRSPGPFVATWTHVGGLAANAVQVKVVNAESGAAVLTSAWLLMAVANNGTISVPFATAFPGKQLPWDEERLEWTIRGRDTANAWSGWGEGVGFWTNDPPSVPLLLTPANEAVVTAYPRLSAVSSDTDDAPANMSVWFRIKSGGGGTLHATRQGSYDAVNRRWFYQTVAADLPSGFTAYTWDAYSFDGTVYSGGTVSAASLQASSLRRFTYANGPQPQITSPVGLSTIATQTPTIVWTVAQQTSREVRVVRAGVQIHRSTATTTVKSYTLPALLSTGEQLHEGDVISIAVEVTDSNGLSGTDTISVTLDYPPVTPLQPAARLINGRNDLSPSIVRVSWPQTEYAVDEFRYYRLERRISADMLAANPSLPDEPVVFRRLEVGQTSYDDHEVTSGVAYTYRLRQYVTLGADTLGSATREVDLMVLFEAAIIHDVKDPMARRVVFDARRSRTITTVTDFAAVSPWNQERPVQFESDVYYREVDLVLVLAAKSVQAANYDLFLLERQVKLGGMLCYRDGRGNKLFGRWASGPVVEDPPGGRVRTVRGLFRELAYDPSARD